MRGDIAERDCPAVALAAAGSSPVGLASGSEAPPTSRGLRAPRDYPRYGFNDIELGSIWKERPVEMYLTMEWEAAQRRESASQSSDEKFCKRCRCYSLFEGMTDECCLTKRGEHCNMIGETSRSKKKVRAKPKKPMGGPYLWLCHPLLHQKAANEDRAPCETTSPSGTIQRLLSQEQAAARWGWHLGLRRLPLRGASRHRETTLGTASMT